MNRIRDYLNFALSFAGLGYIVMWPMSAADAHGDLFGAALLCGADVAPLNWLCALPHPLHLSVPLHLLGVLAACYVAIRLVMRAVRRLRRRRPAAAFDAVLLAERLPGVMAAPRPRKPPRRLPSLRPRVQFGLRSQQP